jgi:triosephosphate isomerase (TIM)
MRRILIAGNWKEHFNTSQASILLHRLHERIRISRDVEVVLFPNTMVLQPLSMQIDRRKFRLGAQDGYHKDDGAYTGEVSMAMLRDLVHYVLVGHSERRHIFGDKDADIALKVAAAFRNGIVPILCVGETKPERQAGETKQVLHDQISTGLSAVTSEEIETMVIAYEPVWAIGTGDVAKPDQAESAMKQIRSDIAALYGKKVADRVRILYGGSVVPDVARGFLDIPGIDGLLVGGASIKYEQFAGIVDAAYKLQRERGGEA